MTPRERTHSLLHALTVSTTASIYLFLLTLIASSTGNKFAWGALGRIPGLVDGWALFWYELVHSTIAFSFLVTGLGLLLVLTCAADLRAAWIGAALPFRGTHRTALVAVGMTVLVTVIASTSFVLVPVERTGFSWPEAMSFRLPWDTSTSSGDWTWSSWYWFPPAFGLAASLVAPTARRLQALGSLACALLALPLGTWTEQQMGKSYLCYGEPDVFGPALNAVAPVLFLLPLGLALLWKRIQSRDD